MLRCCQLHFEGGKFDLSAVVILKFANERLICVRWYQSLELAIARSSSNLTSGQTESLKLGLNDLIELPLIRPYNVTELPQSMSCRNLILLQILFLPLACLYTQLLFQLCHNLSHLTLHTIDLVLHDHVYCVESLLQ